jgi:hypothetical protein
MGKLTLIFIISFSTRFTGQKASTLHCRRNGRFLVDLLGGAETEKQALGRLTGFGLPAQLFHMF